MQSIARQYKAREDVEGQFTEEQGIGKQDISGQCTTVLMWEVTGVQGSDGQEIGGHASAGQDRTQIGRTQLDRTGHRLAELSWAGQDTDSQD